MERCMETDVEATQIAAACLGIGTVFFVAAKTQKVYSPKSPLVYTRELETPV